VEYDDLITKFFAGEISDCELDELKKWLNLNPENRRIFNQENELWQEASFQTKLENYKTDTAWINISGRLGLGKNSEKSVRVIRKNSFRLILAAASIACLMALGGISLWIFSKRSYYQMAESTTTVETKAGEKAHLILSDSTEVTLNSDSKVQYIGNYNLFDRKVKLTGEAFFDVNTNREKPFVVQVDNMSISATGTRFNVFSFPNENRVETTLEEGVIKITVKGKEPINVRSGQQVIYFVKSGEVRVIDVNTDTYTSWMVNKLRFNDTPLEEVLRRIGRKYNVTFEVANRDLLDLKFTATFIDESIEDVMQMLKTVSPITYKIYYRTSVNDKQYQKPRIVVSHRKAIK
jgi:transmembrane sensor